MILSHHHHRRHRHRHHHRHHHQNDKVAGPASDRCVYSSSHVISCFHLVGFAFVYFSFFFLKNNFFFFPTIFNNIQQHSTIFNNIQQYSTTFNNMHLNRFVERPPSALFNSPCHHHHRYRRRHHHHYKRHHHRHHLHHHQHVIYNILVYPGSPATAGFEDAIMYFGSFSCILLDLFHYQL